MISYIKATEKDLELLMQSRQEMLRAVNHLRSDYRFTDEFITCSMEYFKAAHQTTILAINEKVIGCATMCYIDMMPTFSHPTGKRAHLMNVYTNPQYRRQGIAFKMLGFLINDAKEKGVTEISLDATELGRDLYKKHGFVESNECMVLIVK